MGDAKSQRQNPSASSGFRLDLLDPREARDIAGLARIEAENARRRAAKIGKALEGFDGKGEGRIEVLVTP